MDIITTLQNGATPFLDSFFKVLGFLGEFPFFALVLGILFWCYNKKFALQFGLSFGATYAVCGLGLKNLFNTRRPFDISNAVICARNCAFGGLPSLHTALASSNATFINLQIYNKNKTLKLFFKIAISALCLILILGVGLSRMYFGYVFLLDVLIGLAVGIAVSTLVFYFCNFKNEHSLALYFLPFLFASLFVAYDEIFTTILIHKSLFQIVGFLVAFIIGYYFEKKYVDFIIKSNKLFTFFKALCGALLSFGIYYLLNLIFPHILIFYFINTFIVGLVVTLVCPLFFKFFEKYMKIEFKNDPQNSAGKGLSFKSAISKSEKQTLALAKNFASKLKAGTTILLYGDLGCGKTVFSRGIIKYFGITKAITSPTFTILNEYDAKIKIYHYDMYRLADSSEAMAIGANEVFDDGSSIKIVEWPDIVKDILPSKNVIRVTIKKIDDNTRQFDFEEQ